MVATGAPPESVGDTLRALKRAGRSRETSIGDLLDAFGQRTYGPLLFAIGVIALSPIGAIPGASVVCASLVILLALQMSFSTGAPWAPRPLRRITVGSGTARHGIDKVEPHLRKLDRVIRPRWHRLLGRPALHLVSAALCVLAALMYPLALVPWGVMPVAAAITVISLGLLGRDGLLVAIGLGATLLTVGFAGYALAL